MEQQNCLGIYFSKNHAAVVLLTGRGGHLIVKDSFSVSTEADDDAEAREQTTSLAAMIARKLTSRNLKFNDVTAALDCNRFIQHDLHSEFTDHKQISQTIRFDAEEAVAVDATELAITFNITDTDKNGSNISVFTARRELLTRILTDLQHNNLDPVILEPDIMCLARLLRERADVPPEDNPLFIVFSFHACYIINIDPSRPQFAPAVRSFLINPSQDKTDILARQIPLTLALHSFGDQISIKAVSNACDVQRCYGSVG